MTHVPVLITISRALSPALLVKAECATLVALLLRTAPRLALWQTSPEWFP